MLKVCFLRFSKLLVIVIIACWCVNSQRMPTSICQRRFWVATHQLTFQDEFVIQTGKWLGVSANGIYS